MSYFVYIVKCQDNSLYTGITWNLKKRITEHNSGVFQNFTKSRRPVKLVFWEKFENQYLAAIREREIKGWTRIKKEKLIMSLH